jgi:glycosyltransferase involved in cell wall biosynthesis
MTDQRIVHLVYPTDVQRKSSPWSVGNHLSEKLREQFEVRVHDWDASYVIDPKPGDVLIGHPHPRRNTVFRQSFHSSWTRRYVICPFTTNPQQMYFVEPYANEADAFFAICGPVWSRRMKNSIYSHLEDKFVHLDMAINVEDWLPLERDFAPVGERRFAFIGSSLALKGTPFLEHLAARRPKQEIGWIGASSWVRSNAECIEFLDLTTEDGRHRLGEFDFVLSPGRSDANPTVLLEAMSLGLLPICTNDSGYEDSEHFYLLDYGNVEGGIELLRNLQSLTDQELLLRRNVNKSYVTKFSWDRFTHTVLEKIEADLVLEKQDQLAGTSPQKGFGTLYRSWTSPYRRWRSLGIVKIFENRLYFRFAQIAKMVSR